MEWEESDGKSIKILKLKTERMNNNLTFKVGSPVPKAVPHQRQPLVRRVQPRILSAVSVLGGRFPEDSADHTQEGVTDVGEPLLVLRCRDGRSS